MNQNMRPLKISGYSLSFIAMISLFACKEKTTQQGEIPVIDIAEALNNPTEIKLSQLGSKITYIPLELTDSALIGERPAALTVTSEYIFVSNNNIFSNDECMAFDRKTGKFISSVGHTGQGPQAFSENVPVIDDINDKVTFPGMQENLVVYTPEGKFTESISLPLYPGNINSYVFADNNIIIYDGASFGSSTSNILKLSSSGELLDSVLIKKFDKSNENNGDVVNSIAVGNTLGTLPGLVLITKYNDETVNFKFRKFRWLWKFDQNVRFYDYYRDTIFNYADNKLNAEYAVNLGDYPRKDYGDAKHMARMPIIRTFLENSEKMLFIGNAGIQTGSFFAGIYNKATRQTHASIITTSSFKTDGFENDIDGFMPVLLTAISDTGEFVGMLTIEQIQTWIENHPDYEFSPEMSRIKDLDDDSNPVVVILSK